MVNEGFRIRMSWVCFLNIYKSEDYIYSGLKTSKTATIKFNIKETWLFLLSSTETNLTFLIIVLMLSSESFCSPHKRLITIFKSISSI